MPAEAQEALWLLSMCERFGKLPEEIYAADSQLLRLLEIERMVRGGE